MSENRWCRGVDIPYCFCLLSEGHCKVIVNVFCRWSGNFLHQYQYYLYVFFLLQVIASLHCYFVTCDRFSCRGRQLGGAADGVADLPPPTDLLGLNSWL